MQIDVFPHGKWKRDQTFESRPRVRVPTQPIDRRIGVSEIELGYNLEQAMCEGDRCLQCWVNTIFEGTEEAGSECILCGGCVDVCPENCFELAPVDWLDADGEALALSEEQLQTGVSAHGNGFATLLIKNEESCTRCGLCEQRCPVGCITMESFLAEAAVAN